MRTSTIAATFFLAACGAPHTPPPAALAHPSPAPEAPATASVSAPGPAERDPDDGKGLPLGGSAYSGHWTVTFAGREGGLAVLEARYGSDIVGRWRPSDDREHQLATAGGVFTLKVTTKAVHESSVELVLDEDDGVKRGAYGERLTMPGIYDLADGFRIKIDEIAGCDFDPSAPCPYGGQWRYHAWEQSGSGGARPAFVSSGALDRPITFRGRSIEPGRRVFVVRRR